MGRFVWRGANVGFKDSSIETNINMNDETKFGNPFTEISGKKTYHALGRKVFQTNHSFLLSNLRKITCKKMSEKPSK